MNARALVKALGGHWCGSYGMAHCPSHDDPEPSLKIRDDGRKSDRIDVHCFGGCDWRTVKDALRRRSLIDGNGQSGTEREPSTVEVIDRKAERNREIALATWRECRPAAGTVVEAYLQARAITIPIPPSLRHHATLRHTRTGLLIPAMVAGVQDAAGDVVAIHRTYLRRDGKDKAPVSPDKMALAPIAGCAVRLGPAQEELGFSEGIETGLSCMQLYDGSVLATCGPHGDKIQLPDVVQRVVVYRDVGNPGRAIAERLAASFHKQGRKVTIVTPTIGADFNDVLRATRSEAAQ